MRIAMPVDGPQLGQNYSAANTFSLFDVSEPPEGGLATVTHAGRHLLPEHGCAASAGQLKQLAVEAVIAHDISQTAINELLALGILTLKDVPVEPTDAILARLVSGTLQGTPPDPAIHTANAEHEECSGHNNCPTCPNRPAK